jgi:hypothetical protein
MATGDVYKVTFSGTGQGSIYQNVLNVRMRISTDPTNVMFQTLMTDFCAIFYQQQATTTHWDGWEATQQWGPNMTIDKPRCRRLDGKQFAGAQTITGIGAGDALPPQSALVFTWFTGISGRRHRGRSYIWGLREADQAEGLWTTSMLSNWSNNLNTFLALYRGSPAGTNPNFTLGVWSERQASGCVPATPPATGHVNIDEPDPDNAFTPINTGAVREIVYSQRRRTRGVGR